MFFLKKEDVSEFQDRCVIAIFLKFYSELSFVKYEEKNHFIGVIGDNTESHIYLFHTPDNKKPKGIVFRFKKAKNVEGFEYEIFKDDFINEYTVFANNPFEYIMMHFFEEKWEEKYKVLFVSNPPIEKNYEIMYKYKSNPNENDKLAVNQFWEFVNGKLTFVNPNTCNDPFDCDCEIPSYDSIPIIIYKAIQKTTYSRLSAKKFNIKDIKEVLDERDLNYGEESIANKDFFEPIINQLYFKEPLVKMKLEAIVENCVNMASQFYDLKDSFRILCLTRSPRDILMWGYYGNSGEGICCGHKISSINNGIQTRYKNNICVYGDVSYPENNHKPKFKAKTNDIADDIMNFIIECTFTKYHKWGHEKEFRYVLIGDDFESNWVTIDSKTDCIYLGCKNNEVEIYKNHPITPSPYRLKKDQHKYELI